MDSAVPPGPVGGDFASLLRHRRSIRSFRKTPIEPEKLESILAAADIAPSAGNLQAYRIVCVTEALRRTALAVASFEQEFVARAAAVLVFLADPERSRPRYGRRGAELYALQDATIACAYAQLRVADLGLGSTWVGAFDERAVSKAIQAPAGLRPVAILPIGYPAETVEPSPRRGVADLVSRERV